MTSKPVPGAPATLEVGGKTLTLRYPFRVLRDLEKAGIALFQDPMAVLVSTDKLTTALHAGVKSEHPDITMDWLLDNLDSKMMGEIIQTVAYASSGNWAEPKADAVPNPAAPSVN